MNIHHHPDDATIMASAAGSLGEGFSMVLSAHMEYCARCRSRLADAEHFGGVMLDKLSRVSMSQDSLARVWEQIQSTPAPEPPKPKATSTDERVPRVLAPYLDGTLDSLRWRSLVPGIRQYVFGDIKSGGGSVRLLSIAPGTTIPHHTHGGAELTLVLDGSYVDEIGRFGRGDLADLDTTVHHQPVADTNEPCICLIATDERLRFSGVFSRMLQPLVGI